VSHEASRSKARPPPAALTLTRSNAMSQAESVHTTREVLMPSWALEPSISDAVSLADGPQASRDEPVGAPKHDRI
jgi:hypothetical protein